MSSPLTQARVVLDGGEHRTSEIDLSGYILRGIFSPEGHKLGKVTMVTKLGREDDHVAVVPIELADNDEDATLLNVEKDWPLWITAFDVERPLDESALVLFLILEHRG